MKIAFLIGYSGKNFAGSQFQTNKRTVEGEFVKAGIKFGLWSGQSDAEFRPAGRTDKGVSARRQIITVKTDKPELAAEAMNFYLPDDIWCHAYSFVDDDYNIRYSAGARTYRYYFPYPAEHLEDMKTAAELFEGRHNFSGFSKMEDGRRPERNVIYSRVFEGKDGCPVFEVKADSFLWNMVRGMAGFLESVGFGFTDPKTVRHQLENPKYRVHPAPASGLLLYDIDSGIDFIPMKQRLDFGYGILTDAVEMSCEKHVLETLIEEEMEELQNYRIKRGYSTLFRR